MYFLVLIAKDCLLIEAIFFNYTPPELEVDVINVTN